MRDLQEIKASKRIIISMISDDGFDGVIQMPLWIGSIICSWGGGWEHVSVCPKKRNQIPTWNDMCLLKDIIFKDDETAIQIHPVKNEYVNNMPNCLHLWRYADGDMILPPSFMVGMRNGQTYAEVMQEMKEYYAARGEKL